MSASEHKTAEFAAIDDRYEIEAELGRGGAGHVYRVRDRRDGRSLALKKLIVSGQHSGTLRAMFEHEYHTLIELAHPRIVSVFDYGLDGSDPYYTMELLDGADSRQTQRERPLSISQICLLLRDAASALALVHSRRSVHRDVSPRNLWCTPDGRGKLIDFGTLVPMGPQTRVAGTPPFVPPEALYLQPLDARSDIYGLGALAYFLLTERHAYPAREIKELPEYWKRRPARPDRLKSELPVALSDLVMSMLSLDARGRPSSAAEVVERLTAIGALPHEDESTLAQAFLISPKLFGREQENAKLRKRLLRTLRGQGGTLSLVAPAGLGRSRLLASFVLEAKLMGAATIHVDATAVGSGALAVATVVAERLLELVPMAAAGAIEVAGLLAQLSPELHRRFAEPAHVELPAQERTRKLGAAIVTLVHKAIGSQPLVIAIDDVHRADAASLGVLGRLSVLAGERGLLLVTTADADALTHAPPALEHLTEISNRLPLAPLSAKHTGDLLSSLFGAVPGLDAAASWLHELSQGSPQTCMQYAQYLVDHGIARYEGGKWRLPQQLRDQELPATLGAMLEDRLNALSHDARTLALGLALARDDSRSAWQPETHVQIEDFPKLIAGGAHARTYRALDELLLAGIAQQRDNYYVLGQRAMVDALLRIESEESARAAHARLATVFQQAAYRSNYYLGIRHLQAAGDHAGARKALLAHNTAMGGGTMDWGAMRLSVTAAVTLRALEDWQKTDGPVSEGLSLRRLLILICTVYDWSLTRFGDEQIAQLRTDVGLTYWDQTDATEPGLQRVIECLKRAQQSYDKTPKHERGYNPGDAIRELAGCVYTLSAGFGNAFEIEALHKLKPVLAPLRSLSPLIELLADSGGLTLERVCGREVGVRLLEKIERLLAATDLPEVLRLGGAAVNAHIQACEDARLGRMSGFGLMDRVAERGAGEDMFLVVHGRWLGHAFGGRDEQAGRFKRQVEVITEDDVWRRKAHLFVEAELYALSGDLPALNRCCEGLAELASTFPGWRPWSLWAGAELYRLRGELPAAKAQLAAALEGLTPGSHRAWLFAATAQAELCSLAGDPAGALEQAQAICDAVKAERLERSMLLGAERIAALAHQQLRQHAEARACLERAFALAHELECGGLPLARLYEAEARCALTAGEGPRCEVALTRFWSLIDHAHAPALLNAYEALRQESQIELAIEALPAALSISAASSTEMNLSLGALSEVRSRISVLDAQQARALEALQLLLEETGARVGHLFLLDQAGLYIAAPSTSKAPERLLVMAQRCFDAQCGNAMDAATTIEDQPVRDERGDEPALGSDEHYVALPLSDHVSGRAVLTGVVLLASPGVPLRMPRPDFIHAVSRCLHLAGDSLVLPIAE